jgi:hypothetical protein
VGVGSDLTATAQRSKLDVKHPWKHDHSYGSEEVIRNKLVLRSSEVKNQKKLGLSENRFKIPWFIKAFPRNCAVLRPIPLWNREKNRAQERCGIA